MKTKSKFYTIKELADIYNRGASCVATYLKQAEIKAEDAVKNGFPCKVITEEQKKILEEKCPKLKVPFITQDDLSIKQISKIMKLSVSTIHTYFKDHNIKTKWKKTKKNQCVFTVPKKDFEKIRNKIPRKIIIID